MIHFKTIRWQNILSTGNQFTEIQLDRSKSTLIIGENGAGKSTILDALCFALYGKAFRSINKPQLVNSITGKNALVECEFSIGSKDYLIRRGIAPNIFEIFVNGILLNQNSSNKDYQSYLETNILKLNFKSFGQIVVLGSANFIPFMQLTAQSRRAVIEDLLDIQIFSTMNTLLKEKVSQNKTDIVDADYQINLTENKIEMHKKHLNSLQQNNEELIANKQELIDGLQEKIAKTVVANEAFQAQIDKYKELAAGEDAAIAKKAKLPKLLDIERKFESKVRSLKKEIAFFNDHDNCPTCAQGIDHDFKDNRVITKTAQLEEINEAMSKLVDQINKQYVILTDIATLNGKRKEFEDAVADNLRECRAWNQNIANLMSEIEKIRSNVTVSTGSDELVGLNKTLKSKTNNKEALRHQKELLDVSSFMLKDSGIKTKIIKQYVPVMNKLINKYLAAMEFLVQFELDENFNEKIKSRFRDEFSYASFSEGEKSRLDLALLFTWRAISKLRNSASTNLLILDEVFDSSLDNTGNESLIDILSNVDGNVFVISHKGDQLYDKFHSVIKFEKNKNFSRIAA